MVRPLHPCFGFAVHRLIDSTIQQFSEAKPMIRSGIGYDIHRFADGLKLILGGVEIAHARGLEGHSDADVLSHAIADALLGAIACERTSASECPSSPRAWAISTPPNISFSPSAKRWMS